MGKRVTFLYQYDQNYFKSASNHCIVVLKDNYYGLIDHDGKVLIPCQYFGLEEMSPGIFCFRTQENKYGVMDVSGKIIVPPNYDWVEATGFPGLYEAGYYHEKRLKRNKIWEELGYIDRNGNIYWKN
jgi:hypothetical protein